MFTDGVNGWTITDFDAEKLGLSNDLLTIGGGQTGEINQTCWACRTVYTN